MKRIMFNDRYGLTEAVLQGKKTVTRRITQQSLCLDDAYRCGHTQFKAVGDKLRCYTDTGSWIEFKLPYMIGEIVAVAQSYNTIEEQLGSHYVPSSYPRNGVARSNKMFVLADAMPYQIRILDVRAERLQDITDEDCLREGVSKERPEFYDLPVGSEKIYFHYHNFSPNATDYSTFDSAKEAFASLIDKISGKGTWERNPFVWRIEFELVK